MISGAVTDENYAIKWPIALLCSCAVAFIPTSILPLVPFNNQSVKNFLVALTVGMLVADVFLLVLPHLLHLHHEAHHSEPPPPPPTEKKGFWKKVFSKNKDEMDPTFSQVDSEDHDIDDPFLMVVLMGFLLFFFLERFFQSFEDKHEKESAEKDEKIFEGPCSPFKKARVAKDPSANIQQEGVPYQRKKESKTEESEKKIDKDVKKDPEKKTEDKTSEGGGDKSHDSHHGHDDHHGLNPACKLSLAMDAIHNASDGLRLGVAFFTSLAGGMGMSVVFLIHELAHELGDTTTLVQHGQSPIHAIHFQHKTATMLFLGCAVGLTSERYLRGSDILMALSAGAYLYVACVKMLPKLLARKNADLMNGIVESCAILLGFFLMKKIVQLELDGLIPLIHFAEYIINSDFIQRFLGNLL